jgi:hypothetical protein
MNEKLLANVRFYFAQSVFMTSCHYKAYERLNRKKSFNSNLTIFLSAVTILLLVLQIVGLQSRLSGLLIVVAFVGLLLTGSSLVFELMNKEDITFSMIQHKIFAEKYKTLRDNYMSLIEDIMDNDNIELLKTRRDNLQNKYSMIGEHAPSTNYKDYIAAKKNLGLPENQNEEFTWTDNEIDKFLPRSLKLIK